MSRATYRPPYQYMLGQLRAARAEAGLSQAQVAERLGTTQTFVSKVERGERKIDPVELSEFAALYGKEPGDFLLRPKGLRSASAPAAEPVEKTVTLPGAEAEALGAVAYERGASEESLIQEAVHEYLRRGGS